jgi:hypothetical protein
VLYTKQQKLDIIEAAMVMLTEGREHWSCLALNRTSGYSGSYRTNPFITLYTSVMANDVDEFGKPRIWDYLVDISHSVDGLDPRELRLNMLSLFAAMVEADDA